MRSPGTGTATPNPLLDALPFGFIELDGQDQVTAWNETMAQWSGIPAGHALGRPLRELFPQGDAIPRHLAAVRSTGRPRLLSQLLHEPLLPIQLPPGNPSGLSRLPMECHLVPLAGPEGHLGISVMDVSEDVMSRRHARSRGGELRAARERAERALQDRERLYATSIQREERYRSMVDNLREVVFQTNAEGQWTFLNPVWTEITGYPVEETLGTGFLEFVHPEDLPRKEAALRELEEGKTDHCRLDLRYRTPDGGFRWVEELIQRTHDRNGRLIGWSGTLNDITSRRDAEAALRESEARFRQLAENIQEVFWMTNTAKTEILYVSPAYERVWGRTCESLYLRPAAWIEAIHPEDRGRVLEAAQFRQSDGSYREEYRVVRPDGSERWVLDSAFPVRNEAGEVFRIVGVAQDITERHNAEVALVDARDAAEAASRAKSEFMAKMSHEIRTPLNGVLGFAELLLDSKLDLQQRESAAIIRESGAALLEIINDILDFSKIEAGRLEIDRSPFDPGPIIGSVLKLFEAATRKKGIDLRRLAPAGQTWTLVGDAGRFRQVLTNLIGNAVKFTDQGGVTLAIEQAPAPEDGGTPTLRLAITDTGIGIPPEKQSLLFREFSQVDGSTTRKYGGTGLGLAICKRLVELMGGAIGCDSAPDRGSTFWFTMPLAAATAAAAQAVAPAVPPEATRHGPAPRPGLRVLLAEDNRTNRLLATRMLARLGCTVETAVDGHDVIRRVQESRCDLILMDCHMPELDGFDATVAIRRLPGAAGRIPIIALTASAFAEDRQRCLASGMNDFLAKPIDSEELSAALGRWGGPGSTPTVPTDSKP